MSLSGWFALFLAIVPISSSGSTEVLTDRTYSLMTFNIVLGVKADMQRMSPRDAMRKPKNGVPEIIAAIKATHPDFVTLLEVFRAAQAKQIAMAAGLNFHYEPYFYRADGREGPIGQSILSRYTIESIRSFTLPGATISRKLSLATVRISSRKVTIATLHRDRRIVDGSDYSLIKNVVKSLSGPILLAGDFNQDLAGVEPELNEIGLVNAIRAISTSHAQDILKLGSVPSGQLVDHIFVSAKYVKITDFGFLPPKFRAISDHRPLIATFRLLN